MKIRMLCAIAVLVGGLAISAPAAGGGRGSGCGGGFGGGAGAGISQGSGGRLRDGSCASTTSRARSKKHARDGSCRVG